MLDVSNLVGWERRQGLSTCGGILNVHMAEAHSMVKSVDAPWYFACDCGAKFFHEEQSVQCPRCGACLTSPERIRPPWQKKTHTVKEAAKLLAVSESWLYERAGREEIPHHKLGGTALRFTTEDIDEILQEAKKARRKPDTPPRRKIPDSRPRLNFKR